MELPFGAVQIRKSYRNVISPRQGMIRLREVTQAEAEIFVNPESKRHPNFGRYADYAVDLWGIEQQQQNTDPVSKTMREAVDEGIIANEYIAYYLALTHDLLTSIGIDRNRLRFRQHLPDERAHYAPTAGTPRSGLRASAGSRSSAWAVRTDLCPPSHSA